LEDRRRERSSVQRLSQVQVSCEAQVVLGMKLRGTKDYSYIPKPVEPPKKKKNTKPYKVGELTPYLRSQLNRPFQCRRPGPQRVVATYYCGGVRLDGVPVLYPRGSGYYPESHRLPEIQEDFKIRRKIVKEFHHKSLVDPTKWITVRWVLKTEERVFLYKDKSVNQTDRILYGVEE